MARAGGELPVRPGQVVVCVVQVAAGFTERDGGQAVERRGGVQMARASPGAACSRREPVRR
jgi:hypothetical protein